MIIFRHLKDFGLLSKFITKKILDISKFRLTIKVKDGLDREVFRRTMEKKMKSFSNDIVRYEIEELRDFI
ncbi:MAG: hypothetical protein IPH11_13115 [Ignavibacteriales bacterium]|nr:hypothetical protein [Ignavibacteriales bacterium]